MSLPGPFLHPFESNSIPFVPRVSEKLSQSPKIIQNEERPLDGSEDLENLIEALFPRSQFLDPLTPSIVQQPEINEQSALSSLYSQETMDHFFNDSPSIPIQGNKKLEDINTKPLCGSPTGSDFSLPLENDFWPENYGIQPPDLVLNGNNEDFSQIGSDSYSSSVTTMDNFDLFSSVLQTQSHNLDPPKVSPSKPPSGSSKGLTYERPANNIQPPKNKAKGRKRPFDDEIREKHNQSEKRRRQQLSDAFLKMKNANIRTAKLPKITKLANLRKAEATNEDFIKFKHTYSALDSELDQLLESNL